MSTKPGATTAPATFRTVSPSSGSRCSPISATTPLRIRTSRTASSAITGSTTLPPAMRRPVIETLQTSRVNEQIQYRHPNGHAVVHLARVAPAREIQHGIVELHSAIVRTGVHDDRIVTQQAEPAAIEPIAGDILFIGDRHRSETLPLNAQ